MSPYSLPMPTEELAARLSRALAPHHDPVELVVARPTVVEAATTTGEGLAFRVDVAVTLPGQHTQRWQVTFPIDPIDLDPDVSPSAFVITMRANIEEWWATKDREPMTAAWGRRLD